MSYPLCITNLPTLVSIFTIIGAGATAIYAFIAANTLSEIRNQRETTYKPDLILEEFQFYIYGYNVEDLFYPCDWSEKDLGLDFTPQIPNSRFYLKIHNIGLGAAKHINAIYEINIDNCIDFLEQENDKAVLNQQFKIIKTQSLSIQGNLPILNSRYFINEKINKFTIGHILPASIIKDPTELQIPRMYLEFISLNLYLIDTTKKETPIPSVLNLKELPPLILNLSYSDISNKIHFKQFKVEFEFIVGRNKQITAKFKITETTPNPES